MHSSLLPHPFSPAPTYALSLNLIHSIASSQYDRFAHQMTLHFVFAVLLFCNQIQLVMHFGTNQLTDTNTEV